MEHNIEVLFKEKIDNRKQTVVEKKTRKRRVKKKDIKHVDIFDSELKYCNYSTTEDEIKIYNGIVIGSEPELHTRIDVFKFLASDVKKDFFTPVIPSTLAARGHISNINFSEENIFTRLVMPAEDLKEIVKIGCNFCELIRFPSIYTSVSLETIFKSIRALRGVNIRIGCLCQKEISNIPEIYDVLVKIDENKELFMEIYKNSIKPNLEDGTHAKKKSAQLVKNFSILYDARNMMKDEIAEIYDIIELYLKDDIEKYDICINYIETVLKAFSYFTNYEKSCMCRTNFPVPELNSKSAAKLGKGLKYNTSGRKPKKVKESKRKKQGTSMYFNSQLSFDIYNEITNKIMKIKVFRNGNFQVPGIEKQDMTDLVAVIQVLCKYFKIINPDSDADSIKIKYFSSIMRNYTCRLVDENVILILDKLEDILHYEKDSLAVNHIPMEIHKKLQNMIVNPMAYSIMIDYMGINVLSIAEIIYDVERYPALLIKFNRPMLGNKNKKVTIKIMSSGKINFDGATSELEMIELYYWTVYIFNKYWSEIVFDQKKALEEMNSDDSDDYKSIYDDE